MDKTIIKSKLNELVTVNSLNKLITDFNKILKSVLEYSDSVLYFYDEEIVKVRAYRFYNNNVYTKIINLNIENTLFEQSFLLGKSIITSKLDYYDLYKNQSYLSDNCKQIISIPLSSGDKTVATIEFKQYDTYKVDIDEIKDLLDFFTVKLIDFLYFEKEREVFDKYSEYVKKLELMTFDAYKDEVVIEDKTFKKVIKKLYKDKINEKLVVKDEETYMVYINNTETEHYHGFVKKVNAYNLLRTGKHNEKNSVSTKDNLLKKINSLSSSNEIYSIIKFSFKENYQKEVFDIVSKVYNEIYKVSEEFVVISNVVDKRTLRHKLDSLVKEFDKILTLDVKMACVVVNKDYDKNESLLEVLDIMIEQNQLFYSKEILKRHYDKRKMSQYFKKIVNARTFKIHARAILNYYRDNVAFYVLSEFYNYRFDDNRFSLIVLDEVVKKVLKLVKSNGIDYYIDIPSYLIEDINMYEYLQKKCSKVHYAKENICFIVTEFKDEQHTLEFIKKMIKNGYRVGLKNEFDMLFQKNYSLKISAMFLDVEFSDENKLYFNFLKQIYESRFIDIVFTVDSNDDFLKYQRLDFGTCLTGRSFDINKIEY